MRVLVAVEDLQAIPDVNEVPSCISDFSEDLTASDIDNLRKTLMGIVGAMFLPPIPSWPSQMRNGLWELDPDDDHEFVAEWDALLKSWGLDKAVELYEVLIFQLERDEGLFDGTDKSIQAAESIIATLPDTSKNGSWSCAREAALAFYRADLKLYCKQRRTWHERETFKAVAERCDEVLRQPEHFQQFRDFITTIKLVYGEVEGLTA